MSEEEDSNEEKEDASSLSPEGQESIDDILGSVQQEQASSSEEEKADQGGVDDILGSLAAEEDESADQGGIDDILSAAGVTESSDDEDISEEELASIIGGGGQGGGQDDISALLGQGDIDSLMQEAISDAPDMILRYTGEPFAKDKLPSIEICDFRNPVFLSENELRQIRIRHESFMHYLAAQLSIFLRMDVTLNMSKLHTLPYEKFLEGIPNPTYINLFKIEPFSGVGVFNINPRLALTMVNRMLGGKGHSVGDDRYLTEIEMTIVDDVIQIIIDEWMSLWSDMKHLGELESSFVGRENNGRFLQTAPRDAIMLILDVETGVGDCSDLFQMAFPYYFMEPIVKTLQQQSKKYENVQKVAQKAHWYASYSNIDVVVKAEWEPFPITISDLLRLREGDILEFPANAIQNTRLRVHDEVRFIGEAGIENDHVAVQINEKLESEGVEV